MKNTIQSGCSGRSSCWLLLLVILPFVPLYPSQAQGHKETTLYSFTGQGDGGYLGYAPVVRDAQGNLYGTTFAGGDLNCNPPYGCGTVYKLDSSGVLSQLYAFTGTAGDARNPTSGVVRDNAGNLYGTASGGASSNGSVFVVNATGQESVLYSFGNFPDGSGPEAGLVRDAQGNLYGVTIYGGISTACGGLGCGTVFKIDSQGVETVLYRFAGSPSDGSFPYARLIRDANGNLYGVTSNGGTCCGVVFKVSPSGNETVLYTFIGGQYDGSTPTGRLLRDAAGNLYGTTEAGGRNGKGVIFKLNVNNSETILYNFAGPDGSTPVGGLISDKKGGLYGTTVYGGASNLGTVFKLNKTGTLTVLHSFAGPADGSRPEADLIHGPSGTFYGTTGQGGDSACNNGFGCGTVFKLVP